MAITRSTQPAAALLLRLSQSFVPVHDVLAEVLRRRHIRRNYGRMSDTQLRDIGLTPYDVTRALSLTLAENAGDALAKAAAAEAAKW